MESLLKLENVGVAFRKGKGLLGSDLLWALRNINLEIRRGETLGIVGHNGAGKSTLLKLLADIIGPDEGRVIRSGARATLLSLQLGFISHLSGRTNAILGGMLLGLSRAEVIGRMDELIEFSELDDFIDEPVRTYSSGMRARLGFALAINARADILLLDEVLGVGDAAFREKSEAAMRKLIDSEKTVVLVAHNYAMIEAVCERVVMLDHGKTLAQGETHELLSTVQETRLKD